MAQPYTAPPTTKPLKDIQIPPPVEPSSVNSHHVSAAIQYYHHALVSKLNYHTNSVSDADLENIKIYSEKITWQAMINAMGSEKSDKGVQIHDVLQKLTLLPKISQQLSVIEMNMNRISSQEYRENGRIWYEEDRLRYPKPMPPNLLPKIRPVTVGNLKSDPIEIIDVVLECYDLENGPWSGSEHERRKRLANHIGLII